MNSAKSKPTTTTGKLAYTSLNNRRIDSVVPYGILSIPYSIMPLKVALPHY